MTDHLYQPNSFSRILNGETPRAYVYEDDKCVVFWTKEPKAQVHLLIIPRKEIVSLQTITADDAPLLGHLQWVAHQMALEFGLIEEGFRVFTNAGSGGGQTVFHLHYHLVSADFALIPKD